MKTLLVTLLLLVNTLTYASVPTLFLKKEQHAINLHLVKTYHSESDKNSYRAAGLIGGGAFILMGCLTPVNRVWVASTPPAGYSTTGQYGQWQKQKWIQDPSKWAPIASGIFIIGVSFALR